MRIVTVVPLRHVAVLERALRNGAEVVNCTSAAGCVHAVRTHRPHALIIDPALLRPTELETILKEETSRHVPVVFYMTLTPDAIQRALPLLRMYPTEVVLAGVDDSVIHLRRVLENLPRVSVQAALMSELSGDLAGLPGEVSLGLSAILVDPNWSTAKELPSRTGVSRRTIDRALRQSSLAPLSRWCSVSRLSRVYATVTQGRSGYKRAIATGGYRTLKALRRQARTIAGASDLRELRQLDEIQFIERAARTLREGST